MPNLLTLKILKETNKKQRGAEENSSLPRKVESSVPIFIIERY